MPPDTGWTRLDHPGSLFRGLRLPLLARRPRTARPLRGRRPAADVLQRQAEFVGVLLQQGLVRLARRLAELGVDLRVPLVNPRQQLVEPRQDGREPLGVPALP